MQSLTASRPAPWKAGILWFLLFLGLVSPSSAQKTTTKKVCLSAVGMQWATSEEAQRHLVNIIKRDAVGELFGEMVWSLSEVKNLVLTRDEIQSFSAGLVRLRGTPQFYNGVNLGEVCVSAELYVTDEDISRFQPRTVSKKVCIADPRLSSGDLRTTAERQSQIQAVRDFEPGLQGLDDELVLRLVHESIIEDAGFVSDTLAYCASSRGIVYPIELLTAMRGSVTPTAKPTTPARDAVVHLLYTAHTERRGRQVQSKLNSLGFQVLVKQDRYIPSRSEQAYAGVPSAGNRLSYPPYEKDTAIEIQAGLRDLVSLKLLPSTDPSISAFTLWIVE